MESGDFTIGQHGSNFEDRKRIKKKKKKVLLNWKYIARGRVVTEIIFIVFPTY